MEKNLIKDIKVNWNADMLSGILCTATYGSDWLEVQVHESSRALAEEIRQAEPERCWCREDVWAEVLLKGGKLAMIDHFAEDDDVKYDANYQGAVCAVSLKEMDMGVKFYANTGNLVSLAQVLEQDGQDDYFDDNNLIQCVMFGELVYG